jgi:hypothetical protein
MFATFMAIRPAAVKKLPEVEKMSAIILEGNEGILKVLIINV